MLCAVHLLSVGHANVQDFTKFLTQNSGVAQVLRAMAGSKSRAARAAVHATACAGHAGVRELSLEYEVQQVRLPAAAPSLTSGNSSSAGASQASCRVPWSAQQLPDIGAPWWPLI